MTDTYQPIIRALNIATDLTGNDIRDVDFSLFDLFMAESRKGKGLVEGKTVTGCRIQGPAVMLASSGVTFDAVNFGDSRGSMRNLIFVPDGEKGIGAIPFRDCAFVNCEFFGVGFTGPKEFLNQMRAVADLPTPFA